MKLNGLVVFAAPSNRYFFLAAQNEKGLYEKFYTNAIRIDLSEVPVGEIQKGYSVRFAVDPKPSAKPNGLRTAIHVEVYTVDPLLLADVLAGDDPVDQAPDSTGVSK